MVDFYGFHVGKYIRDPMGMDSEKINVTLPYPIGEMTIFSYSDTGSITS